MQLFEKAADYQAFEQVLQDTLDQSPMRICAYAVMPNHWHLLLWPECDGELAAFMQRLTITHVRRWQEHRGYAGLGHVYFYCILSLTVPNRFRDIIFRHGDSHGGRMSWNGDLKRGWMK